MKRIFIFRVKTSEHGSHHKVLFYAANRDESNAKLFARVLTDHPDADVFPVVDNYSLEETDIQTGKSDLFNLLDSLDIKELIADLKENPQAVSKSFRERAESHYQVILERERYYCLA